MADTVEAATLEAMRAATLTAAMVSIGVGRRPIRHYETLERLRVTGRRYFNA